MTQISFVKNVLPSHHRFHINMSAPTIKIMSCHNSNPYLTITRFIYMLISTVHYLHLLWVRHGSICMKTCEHLYLLLLSLSVFSHSQRQGGVGYITQYSIYSILKIQLRKHQIDSLNSFLPKVCRYLFTLSISN